MAKGISSVSRTSDQYVRGQSQQGTKDDDSIYTYISRKKILKVSLFLWVQSIEEQEETRWFYEEDGLACSISSL